MKAPKPREGYVDRNMCFRVYPSNDQIDKLNALQPSLRACWNWLVSRIEEVLSARDAKAVKEGLMPAAIPVPDYKGLQPEQSKALRKRYEKDCAERRKTIFSLPIPVEWRPFLSGPGGETERLGLKYSYQVLNNYLDFKRLPNLPAAFLFSIENNFNSKKANQKRKRFRKDWEIMPFQVNSGPRLRPRAQNTGLYGLQKKCNYEVYLPSIGRIPGYLDPGLVNLLLTPGTTLRDGCTVKYDNGKWFAFVNVTQKEVLHPGPNNSKVCGIDPGLDKLVATSDKLVVKNPRNIQYSEARGLALAIAMTGGKYTPILGEETKKSMEEAVYRHDAHMRRRVQTQCRQLAAKLSKEYEFIGIEANQGLALGIGTQFKGSTKFLLKCLTERCGHNRVREIESFHNSQTCSKCGHHDKEAWARKPGAKDQTCTCPACGFTEDRDVNSACNVRNRLAEQLGLS